MRPPGRSWTVAIVDGLPQFTPPNSRTRSTNASSPNRHTGASARATATDVSASHAPSTSSAAGNDTAPKTGWGRGRAWRSFRPRGTRRR
jgi:hypothetical protein